VPSGDGNVNGFYRTGYWRATGIGDVMTLDEIIDAHGGMDLWNSIDELDVVLSSQGFLFTSLMRWRAPVVKRKQVRLLTREPRLTFFDLPESGLRSELIGNDEVRIVDGNGTTVAQQMNPRATFRGLARLTWDALDFTYFAGYALWNYLTTPFLLVYKDVHVGALDPLDGLSRLRVTFPDENPTHSRRQTFYFDNRRRLRRLDYAVDIVSRRVRGAHFCDEYKTFDGLAAPTTTSNGEHDERAVDRRQRWRRRADDPLAEFWREHAPRGAWTATPGWPGEESRAR
jgi:hypothetical protein